MVTFFKTAADLRVWFEKNHETETELFLGYYKKASGIPSVDWSESVDQALCYGWIDGIRRSIDEKSYQIRFTPRRPKSHWSTVNIKKIEQLIKAGLMKAPGLAAWERRDEKNSGKAAFEQKKVVLDPAYEKKVRANSKAALFFFEQLAPSYRKISIHWVMSAKQEATQLRRLGILIESSEQGLKIPQLRKK